jgi:hypothetical protein
MTALALSIFGVHTEWHVHHFGGCTIFLLLKLEASNEYEKKGGGLVEIMSTHQFRMVQSPRRCLFGCRGVAFLVEDR